jgi:hypothetical protein
MDFRKEKLQLSQDEMAQIAESIHTAFLSLEK